MAEVIDTLSVEVPSSEAYIPLEQRTDVTVDELERASLPCNAELYNGKVVFKMGSPEHGMLETKIAKMVDLYLDENPIGYVMTETNFLLWPERDDQSRFPDVAFVKKERMPKDRRRFPPIAPDLAVEIISPDDNLDDVWDKVDEYLEQGTQIVWVVIPKKSEVLVCAPQANKASAIF